MGLVTQICLTLLLVLSLTAIPASSRHLRDESSMIEKHKIWMNLHGRVLGVNAFANLTTEEFRASHTAMDWRKKGAITPIKDQGECGSCWAFSAVASMEALNQIKTGKLVSLSEQELVDCDTKYDEGCDGGLIETAFEFIQHHGGLTTEANYPYKAIDGTCNVKRAAMQAVSIHGYENVPANNEEALKAAVAHQPVSVGIEGSGFDFQFYSSGVFN